MAAKARYKSIGPIHISPFSPPEQTIGLQDRQNSPSPSRIFVSILQVRQAAWNIIVEKPAHNAAFPDSLDRLVQAIKTGAHTVWSVRSLCKCVSGYNSILNPPKHHVPFATLLIFTGGARKKPFYECFLRRGRCL